MICRWTLHVENFSGIEQADITLSPLLCFTGESNTGKSKLMTLLYGILNISCHLFPSSPPDSKSYKDCELWLRNTLRHNKTVLIDKTVVSNYLKWFNSILAKRKTTLLSRAFNHGLDADVIALRDAKLQTDITLNVDAKLGFKDNIISIPKKEKYSRNDLLRFNIYICWTLLMGGVGVSLINQHAKNTVYLPTIRAGLLLTYPELSYNSIQTHFMPVYNEDEQEILLSQPCIEYLKLLVQLDEKKNTDAFKQELIRFIQHEFTHGTLNVYKQYSIPIIRYIPEGSDTELPLHITSPSVLETAPLLLLLKCNIPFTTVIIEEPEAHLSPYQKQKMAQLIQRLVQNGINVWFTTNSETLLQSIQSETTEEAVRLCQYQFEKHDQTTIVCQKTV